jgi:hypothetical protein
MPSQIHFKHVDNTPAQACTIASYLIVFLSIVLPNYISFAMLIPLTYLYANGLDSDTTKQFLTIFSIAATRIVSALMSK